MTDLLEQAATQSEQWLQYNINAHKNAYHNKRDDGWQISDCIDCGEPIGIKRKQALPMAIRCIACQNLLEAKQGGRR